MAVSDQKSIKVRTLPFAIEPHIWETLSPDIRGLMWEGWSLKLQLDELAYCQELDETRNAGLIKPVKPLTPEQSRKLKLKLNAQDARLMFAKRAASCKLTQVQQKLAGEQVDCK